MVFIFVACLINEIELPTHNLLGHMTVKFLIVMLPFIAAAFKYLKHVKDDFSLQS